MKEISSKSKLSATMNQIEKLYGKGSLFQYGKGQQLDIESISTGSYLIDDITGIGGIPVGRIIEIFGPESSGKTTFCLHVIAEAQKLGKMCAFIDAEHALDPDYAKRIGVNTDNLLISQPDSGEQALQIVETLVRSGDIDVIVIDSVAALTPKTEIAGEMGDFQIGLQARLMSQALRKLSGIVAKTKTSIIFLNQTRMKIGVMWGNPETTPGGLALKFYSSVRINLRRIAQIKQKEEIIGSRIKAKIVKNKVAAPFKVVEFDIYYNEGISKIADLINTGLNYGVLEKKGSWLQYKNTKLGQGMEGAKKFLKENISVRNEIKKDLQKEIKNSV